MKGLATGVRRASDSAYAVLDAATAQIVLSLLWLVASVPLLTAPAATVALFTIVGRRKDGVEEPLLRAYLDALRYELRHSSLPGVGWAVVGLVLAGDLVIAGQMDEGRRVTLVLLGSLIVLYLWVSALALPIYARARMRWRDACRGAVTLAAARPFPAAVPVLLVAAAPLVVWILPLLIMIVPAVLAWWTIELVDRAQSGAHIDRR
jgi:uncharacterized membrane protein YesL